METTDDLVVEMNTDAISEIVEVEKEQPGFLLIPRKEAKYDVHTMNGKTYQVGHNEHEKVWEYVTHSYLICGARSHSRLSLLKLSPHLPLRRLTSDRHIPSSAERYIPNRREHH